MVQGTSAGHREDATGARHPVSGEHLNARETRCSGWTQLPREEAELSTGTGCYPQAEDRCKGQSPDVVITCSHPLSTGDYMGDYTFAQVRVRVAGCRHCSHPKPGNLGRKSLRGFRVSG